MRQFYLLIAFWLTTSLSAQTISIPDVAFKNALCNTLCIDTDNNNTYDSDADINNDGEIQMSEALAAFRMKIWNAQITSLEGIQHFANLNWIDVQANQITAFDFLMPNVTVLYIGTNQLSTINLSGLPNLEFFSGNSNLFTTLDFSNTRVTYAHVSNNPNLTYVNLKNGFNSTGSWGFSMTSGELGNLMNLPNLAVICLDENEIATLYSHYAALGLNPPSLTSYCSFEPGGEFYMISGQTRFDIGADGCDASDNPVPMMNLALQNGSYTAGADGGFEIPVVAGTYSITPNFENQSYFTVSPPSLTVTFPGAGNSVTQDFCITPNGNHPDVEVVLMPVGVANPGFDITYNIVYRNKGNVAQSGSLNFDYDDSVMDYLSSTLPITAQSDGLLSWDYSNLLPFETRTIMVTLNLNSPMETPSVNLDDVLTFDSTITTSAGDEFPGDNDFTLNQTVVGSFDPNDKTCLQGNTVGPEMIGEYVHYVIRFENTGTFAAQNIVVKDMIDTAKFDISTLIPLDASHPFETRITSGNKVEFIFENINLPFDDGNNDGYVAFKIKTQPTLVLGDTFSNTASIYFDYNFPIITNTATTSIQQLGTNDFEFSKHFTLYPVPAGDRLKIKSDFVVSSVSVYNSIGQLLLSVSDPNLDEGIDVSGLAKGSYFVRINSDKGSSSSSFVKD